MILFQCGKINKALRNIIFVPGVLISIRLLSRCTLVSKNKLLAESYKLPDFLDYVAQRPPLLNYAEQV